MPSTESKGSTRPRPGHSRRDSLTDLIAQCDARFPQCGACASAGVECTGYDNAAGTALPRSAMAELKSRIQQLESRLDDLRSAHAPRDPFGIEKALDDLEGSLADADLESHAGVKWSESHRHSRGASRDFNFRERLLMSPAPFLTIVEEGCRKTNRADVVNPAEKRGRPLQSVPEDVVGILLKNYKDTYLAQYPFLDEDELDLSFRRITNTTNSAASGVSHFDHFSVGMALAISVCVLLFIRRPVTY